MSALRCGVSHVRVWAVQSATPWAATRAIVRCVTTGPHHCYRPGRLARLIRRVYIALTPSRVHGRLAVGLQAGLERVQEMEQEQLWLQRHGSPLQVMGLPDHAELMEVRARYRDLVFATHPDTAQDNARTRYDTIQTAYKMAITPTSLWHQNGSAPALYNHLVSSSTNATRRVTLFAIFSYVVMGLLGIVFSFVAVRQFLEVALRLFDPEFYEFMITQEQEEERKRLAGEPVDTDPKRLAPTVVKRLLFPGRFVHDRDNDDDSSSSSRGGGGGGGGKM